MLENGHRLNLINSDNGTMQHYLGMNPADCAVQRVA